MCETFESSPRLLFVIGRDCVTFNVRMSDLRAGPGTFALTLKEFRLRNAELDVMKFDSKLFSDYKRCLFLEFFMMVHDVYVSAPLQIY